MEGVDFRFLCTNFSTMIDSLTVLGGPCTASVTGVTITSEREAKGIKFTCEPARLRRSTTLPLTALTVLHTL